MVVCLTQALRLFICEKVLLKASQHLPKDVLRFANQVPCEGLLLVTCQALLPLMMEMGARCLILLGIL